MNSHFMGTKPFVWWMGVVEDVQDPLKLGRCKVRIAGFHTENKSLISTENLPWAAVICPITSASVSGLGTSPSGLLPGSWVIGFFKDSTDCQEPIIWGSLLGIPTEKLPGTVGFSDPAEKNPKFLNESDVNRLARNEKTEETIIQLKKINVEKNISEAIVKTNWSEPSTQYNAQYPKNHVIETESGHIVEFDDTPEKERISLYHKSGTFQEIHPSGDNVLKIVGNNYTIILNDNKILIKGNFSQNVSENSNITVGKDLNIQIDGNANVLIKGNSTIETKGDHFHKVSGVYAVASEGNMVFLAPRIDLNPSGENSSSVGNVFE